MLGSVGKFHRTKAAKLLADHEFQIVADWRAKGAELLAGALSFDAFIPAYFEAMRRALEDTSDHPTQTLQWLSGEVFAPLETQLHEIQIFRNVLQNDLEAQDHYGLFASSWLQDYVDHTMRLLAARHFK